ncbi:tRNA threonylcarbamoyladenosine biosynthesis protein TsaE [Candidatus Protochlamydia amoebophila]|uniref:tRNA (adenosine(37)-N6)-threonylcarbamoyltransferase complex ATPase subunit type 1 TsaE n=1 Tax=Candidatus Protochlamydia amoebophila TaxID=362787 RepID=UPI001BC98337|nr:tRNA (adenosine(37)-N6)-threonylcarbamoyltransferase complex ATPase subunit type 1 TsaE [Candidatus Protochlamydia amoebophila]MBS4164455.1 tRNA threonylcarbamoyladenosine biosynthesis protein TsaE [Candidatus Protochlamydia amoebophila]
MSTLIHYHSNSAEETQEVGFNFGLTLPANSVICFFGDLAAGKTTFIKGLVAGASQLDPNIVQSPTFSYLHIYEGKQIVYHFDLYRLKDVDEFLSMGFDEYFESGGICCVEWSERIHSILPPNCLFVILTHQSENRREIKIIEKDTK